MAQDKATQRKRVCVKLVVKLVVYLHLATLSNIRSFWSWTFEPQGFQCQHPIDPLQPNNTKLKVLIYSLAKTGTTQTTNTLNEFYKTYHSEDFMFHFWSPHVDEFWSKPENGGGMWPWQRLATPGYPARHGHSFYPRSDAERPADPYVWNHTTAEEFAYKFQRCGVEGMAFDGYEEVFWDIYEQSPDAKVIILNWRTFDKWRKSLTKFGIWYGVALFLINYMNVGMYFLPWYVITLPVVDWWNGYVVTNAMKNGSRLLNHGTTGVLLTRMATTERRIIQHWVSGLGETGLKVLKVNGTEEEFKAYYTNHWQKAFDRIPEHRRLEFDVSKHTTNHLCKFLGLEGHPNCNDKPLRKDAPVFLAHERTYPWNIPPTIPFFLFVHWVNYKLCWGVLGYIGSCLIQLFGMCGIKCKKRKLKSS